MPLPKSITSLLTAIVVAVPAAITTLALNKPKPPKEIDAVIQLDENKEEIPENEITPDNPTPPSLPPASSQPSSSGGSGGIVGAKSDSEDSQSLGSSNDQLESKGSEEPEEETTPETKEEVKEDEKEEEEVQDNEDDLEEPPTEPEQHQDKDVSVKELEESIVSIIEILINEGKDFDIKNSRLYKQYTISSKLVELQKTIDSWKEKKDKEVKDAQSKGAASGTSAPTEQQGK